MGRIKVANMAHERGTCEPLPNCLAPLDNSIVDSVLLEYIEDLLGDIMSDIGGGRARDDADPNNNRSESPLLLSSKVPVREEASRVDGRRADIPSLDEVTDLWTNPFPALVERGVEDSTDRLDSGIGESTRGLGKWPSEEVRAVNKHGLIAALSDTVIVLYSFVLVGCVLGGSSGITGNTEYGESGRRAVDGRTARDPGDGGAHVVLNREVDTLESE